MFLPVFEIKTARTYGVRAGVLLAAELLPQTTQNIHRLFYAFYG